MTSAEHEEIDEPMFGDAPWWRNPWFIGLVGGMLTITLLRPCTRHIPEPPPVVGELGVWELEDQRGEPVGSETLADTTAVVHFFFTRDALEGPREAMMLEELQANWSAAGHPIQIISISMEPSYDDVGVRSSWAERRGADPDRWLVLGGPEEAVRPIVTGDVSRLLTGAPEPPDDLRELARSGHFILMGPGGTLRGIYPTDHEDTLDEIQHRAVHVYREAR